uniref:ATP-dependent DNA helicase n=1 Tax=Tanacetum cinerariifolium TaxID=118510 RepID=A0A6L2MXL2_TANCI|nr:helicase [Tanacetum cinerariifolium]
MLPLADILALTLLSLMQRVIYSVKNFTIVLNKDEFRMMRFAELMHEFDGETTVHKFFVKYNGFTRYPSQFVEIDALEPTNNRYLIDVAGYLTNVGRTTQTRTGSKTLYFWSANKSDVVGWSRWYVYSKEDPPCGTVSRYCNRRVSEALQYTSSTPIIDDEKIHVLQRMKTDDKLTKEILPVDNAAPKPGNLENLLMGHGIRNMMLGQTRVGTTYRVGEKKCKKCTLDRKDGRFWCDSCNSSVEYLVMRYRLELEISDNIVEDEEDHSGLPTTLANIVGTTHTLELKSHTYIEHGNYESFTCWNIVTDDDEERGKGGANSGTVVGNEASKVWICYVRERVEDYDAEESFVAESVSKEGDVACSSDTRKGRRVSSPNVASWNQPRPEQTRNNHANRPSLSNILHRSVMIHSKIIIRHDETVQGFCGLKLSDIGADGTIVGILIEMLDQNSSIAKAFRMAMDWCHSHTTVNVELRLISKRTNLRQYNAPTIIEVVALITNDFEDGSPTRDIIVTNKDSGLQRISELHPSYMALQYPLLFLYGEDRYHDKISYHSNKGTSKTNRVYVTMKEYYAYVIQYRKDQELLYSEGDTNATCLGKMIVLSHTFIGDPMYMMHNYQDVMALCRTYGNPDLFIAFTSNPKWPKINEMLAYVHGQRSHDRPEVGTRVFKLKLTELLDDLTKNQIDDIILAELPSPTDDPVGYKAVINYMLHGQCGKDARYVACNVEGGTGKTFLYKTIISRLRSERKIVLVVSSSARRTAYSRFFIPLELLENNTCGIKQNTHLAELMQKVELII